jgi:hypothetical protein
MLPGSRCLTAFVRALVVALPLLVWGPGRAGEPADPSAASLAPVDRELLRERYGQESLYRLQLGVDEGERTAGSPGVIRSCSARLWSHSPQQQRYTAALSAGNFFAAGQALGQWRRLCGAGS